MRMAVLGTPVGTACGGEVNQRMAQRHVVHRTEHHIRRLIEIVRVGGFFLLLLPSSFFLLLSSFFLSAFYFSIRVGVCGGGGRYSVAPVFRLPVHPATAPMKSMPMGDPVPLGLNSTSALFATLIAQAGLNFAHVQCVSQYNAGYSCRVYGARVTHEGALLVAFHATGDGSFLRWLVPLSFSYPENSADPSPSPPLHSSPVLVLIMFQSSIVWCPWMHVIASIDRLLRIEITGSLGPLNPPVASTIYAHAHTKCNPSKVSYDVERDGAEYKGIMHFENASHVLSSGAPCVSLRVVCVHRCAYMGVNASLPVETQFDFGEEMIDVTFAPPHVHTQVQSFPLNTARLVRIRFFFRCTFSFFQCSQQL